MKKHEELYLYEEGKLQGVTPQMLAMCSMPEARAKISFEMARAERMLPMSLVKNAVGDDVLRLAVPKLSDPGEVYKKMRFVSGMDVQFMPCPDELIVDAIILAYGEKLDDIETLPESVVKNSQGDHNDSEKDFYEMKNTGGDANRLLSALLEQAIVRKASDLHIVPTLEGILFKLRINGELYVANEKLGNTQLKQQLLTRIKVLCNVQTVHRNRPVDGAFRFKLFDKKYNIRVSIVETVYGEQAVLRLLTAGTAMSLEEIGMSTNALDKIAEIYQQGEGLLLFVGPTGSGKSSTMYSIATNYAGRGASVFTVEDPVEVVLPNITQSAIDLARGFDYKDAIRVALRQDPDVIVVGEIRDSETAKVVANAASTGHVVLSTIHASNVTGVIERLRMFGVDLASIRHSLKLIVIQQLLPRLCQFCRVFDLQGYQEFRRMGYEREVFKPTGCAQCEFTGIKGRVLIANVVYSFDQDRYIEDLSHDHLLENIHEGEISLRDALATGYLPARN